MPVATGPSGARGASVPANAMASRRPGKGSVPAVNAQSLMMFLSSLPQEQHKQLIGEHIFPVVHAMQPELAGKITGMLLEMDNEELIQLANSPDGLQEKVQEAVSVLRNHDQQQHMGGLPQAEQQPISG